jgi:hypothetical protein
MSGLAVAPVGADRLADVRSPALRPPEPEEPGARRSSGDLYTGTVPPFARAGFVEYRRPPTGSRVVMRRPAAR